MHELCLCSNLLSLWGCLPSCQAAMRRNWASFPRTSGKSTLSPPHQVAIANFYSSLVHCTVCVYVGLLVIPNPFREGAQHYWVKRCLVDYPCLPNICSLDAHFKREGTGRVWPVQGGGQHWAKGREGDMLTKLRWVTLGYHYDWTEKEYSEDHKSPFPPDLARLSSFILEVAGFPGYDQQLVLLQSLTHTHTHTVSLSLPHTHTHSLSLSGSQPRQPLSTSTTWTRLCQATLTILSGTSPILCSLSGETERLTRYTNCVPLAAVLASRQCFWSGERQSQSTHRLFSCTVVMWWSCLGHLDWPTMESPKSSLPLQQPSSPGLSPDSHC